MRKLAAAIICAVLILLLAVPALAAGQLQFTVTPSVTQAAPGDTVEFEVSVKGGAYSAIGYIPDYDKNVWEFVKGECMMDYTGLGGFSRSDGGIMSFTDAAVRDGTVFCFTLRVKADAPTGQTTLTGAVAAKDGGTALDAVLTDTVMTIQPKNAQGTDQTDESRPVEPTAPTQSVEETVATQQTQPVPLDQTVAQTQPTAPSQGTDPTQAIAPEETTASQDPTPTIGQSTIPDLGGGDACLDGEGDMFQEEVPAPKDNDSLLIWVAVIVVVAAGAAAAWFFLGKKKEE